MVNNSKNTIVIKIFFRFVKGVVKKWIFWIFLLPNLVDLVIPYYKSFQIPTFLYYIIPLIGFIIASFLVYKDLLDKFPEVEIPNPNLKVSMVEGNEYSFSAGYPYDTLAATLFISDLEREKKKEFHYEEGVLFVENVPQYWLPKFSLTINMRIQNNGNIPVDILLINLLYNSSDFSPLRFHQNAIEINSNGISYPLHLVPLQIEIIKYRLILSPDESKVVSVAQIASELNKYNKKHSLDLKIETIDSFGKTKDYLTKLEISFSPLVDQFITSFQQYHQNDLIRVFEVGKSKK